MGEIIQNQVGWRILIILGWQTLAILGCFYFAVAELREIRKVLEKKEKSKDE